MPIDASEVEVRVDRAFGTELQEVNLQKVLLGRIAPYWKIVQPLVITLELGEDESIIVSDEIFYMYGEGGTVTAAVDDYITALIEYYGLLSAHEDEPTVALFQFLQSYLQPIR